MSVLFLLVFFFVALFIVGLVLLQEGKGGGLTGMSTGMDGVMGAKNPLRRMTAYLFVIFVLLCLGINMYFHNREDASLPSGLELPAATAPQSPIPAPVVEPENLRPATDATDAIGGGAATAQEIAAQIVDEAVKALDETAGEATESDN